MRPCSAANAARCRGSPPPVAGVAGARRRRATSHCYYLHIGLARQREVALQNLWSGALSNMME